jgi:hypothetical protein
MNLPSSFPKWQTISGVVGLTVVFAVLIGGAWATWRILAR